MVAIMKLPFIPRDPPGYVDAAGGGVGEGVGDAAAVANDVESLILGLQVGVLRKVLTVLERHNISVDYVPNGIDNVSVVMPTEAVASSLYTILGEIQKEVEPDNMVVYDQIAVVAAVGRKMAFRPGISGQIFATLGQAGINIRMINQGPDELNIIFGVDNRDFDSAIKVLYNSFVK